MTDEDFRKLALYELANHDTLALVEALRNGSGVVGAGVEEMLRLLDAQGAFPGMSLAQMWKTDHAIKKGPKPGRPRVSDLQRTMMDPAWTAVRDLERLKKLWKELQPSKQVPLEWLTDLAVEYRGAEHRTVRSRRSRPKTRRISEN